MEIESSLTVKSTHFPEQMAKSGLYSSAIAQERKRRTDRSASCSVLTRVVFLLMMPDQRARFKGGKGTSGYDSLWQFLGVNYCVSLANQLVSTDKIIADNVNA